MYLLVLGAGALVGGAMVVFASLPSEPVLGWALLFAAAIAVVPTIFLGTVVIGLMSNPEKPGVAAVPASGNEERSRGERNTVRFGIPVLLSFAIGGAVVVAVNLPKSEIPSFAFGSHVVLAVQLTLLFFYGALLLLVPLVRAIADGELPTELSMRGARWAEKRLGKTNKETLDRLQKVDESTATAKIAIAQIKERIAQREKQVDSLLGDQAKGNEDLLTAVATLKADFRDLVEKPS